MQEKYIVDETTGERRKTVEKMKTRSSEIVKLSDLLDEAKSRALNTFQARIA